MLTLPQDKEKPWNSAQSYLADRIFFTKQSTIQDPGYILSNELVKQSKPLSDGDFLKDCMVDVAVILFPDNKGQFDNISGCSYKPPNLWTIAYFI